MGGLVAWWAAGECNVRRLAGALWSAATDAGNCILDARMLESTEACNQGNESVPLVRPSRSGLAPRACGEPVKCLMKI